MENTAQHTEPRHPGANATDEAIRAYVADLVASRDLRFYDAEDVYRSIPRTAGEVIRLAQREPLLDQAGAEVLEAAILTYALPAWDRRDLDNAIYCLRYFTPRRGARP